jgi:hypothetical protein
MSTGAVQMQCQLGLPPQYAGATVSVEDAAGGQRIVTIRFNQGTSAFASDNLAALTEFVEDMQSQLDDPLQGGNVGEVVIRSQDPATGSPLFTYVADVTWGQRFAWSAPSVKAFTEPADRDSAG